MAKPRKKPDPKDPRCIDYRGGALIYQAFGRHESRKGELVSDIAKAIGIGAETLYSYARGHSTPTAVSREKLEQHMGLKKGALVPTAFRTEEGIQTTQKVEGEFLVVTSYIPLELITSH